MIALPGDTPVATPPNGVMVAMGVALEVQKPPAGPLLSAVVAPTHTPSEPVIGEGTGLMLTSIVA
jgi:hypothetical protein